MNSWNHIYEHFDPVAFTIFSLPVHWYGIMYVLALLSGLYIAKYFIKKDNMPMSDDELDIYFVYVEIGVILGARLGYILFYDTHTAYYLTHFWQIFNPFVNGEFVGIRGMSYHGAMIGFAISTYLYSIRKKIEFGVLVDIVAISVPLAYTFGRIGNFLNQELVGRQTDVAWGILVDNTLRHPSQLYEAFLEGIVLFFIVYTYRKYKTFNGELAIVYMFGYGILRAIAEFWRAPDVQIGYVCCNVITQGQVMSLLMSLIAISFWFYLKNRKAV